MLPRLNRRCNAKVILITALDPPSLRRIEFPIIPVVAAGPGNILALNSQIHGVHTPGRRPCRFNEYRQNVPFATRHLLGKDRDQHVNIGPSAVSLVKQAKPKTDESVPGIWQWLAAN